ncbi:MAG: hypothetical protein PHC64_08640 [Candidatus Gastranaerophilales bacterium]|nr:hypothetical protein [Candidatus Gastranaerophilales bacterium]
MELLRRNSEYCTGVLRTPDNLNLYAKWLAQLKNVSEPTALLRMA